MEILNDILEVQKKQTSEIQRLTKEIEVLKSGANKPINLNAEVVSENIWKNFQPKSNELRKSVSDLHSLLNQIPSAIHNSWGLSKRTIIWVSVMAILAALVYLFAPNVRHEYDNTRIKELEEHLQYHIDKNPKTESSYQQTR
jgi:hypothetical protein